MLKKRQHGKLALGARQKNLHSRPRPSPPQANSGHINFMQVFFARILVHIYVFEKEEKPEMDDFERRKKMYFEMKNTSGKIATKMQVRPFVP